MELLDNILPLILWGVSVVTGHGVVAILLGQRTTNTKDVVSVRRPDDDFALHLFRNVHQLVQAVVRHLLRLAVVRRQEATANLLEPHDLRKYASRGRKLAVVEHGKSQLLHLIVEALLIRR